MTDTAVPPLALPAPVTYNSDVVALTHQQIQYLPQALEWVAQHLPPINPDQGAAKLCYAMFDRMVPDLDDVLPEGSPGQRRGVALMSMSLKRSFCSIRRHSIQGIMVVDAWVDSPQQLLAYTPAVQQTPGITTLLVVLVPDLARLKCPPPLLARMHTVVDRF